MDRNKAAPRVYLSSAPAGWTGLEAAAFQWPDELERYVVPAQPDVTLILFAGGGMCVERRYEGGPWAALALAPEDLFLRPVMDRSYEVRWTRLPAPTRTLHLRLSSDLLSRTAEEVADYDPARLALEEQVGFQDPVLADIGLALWRELEQEAPAGRLYAETAAQMLAVHLLRHYTAAASHVRTPRQGKLASHQVRRVTDYVRGHLTEDLSLAILAQQVGFSPYHFARLFRQTMGESPHHYVLRQRLEHAQRLLQEPLPLDRVARKSGFASQSHFTRTFKRHLGVTPGAYRRAR